MAQPRLIEAAPSFAVADVFASAEYYRDVLGFRFDQFYGNPPSFVILTRDAVRIMLKQVAPEALPRIEKRSSEQIDLYLYATNVRALAEEVRAKGAEIVEGPVDRQIYNGRELIVRDPNGLVLCFGQLLDEHPD